MKYFCPGCRQYLTVARRVGVVLTTAAISGALGGAATRHPLGVLVVFVVGMKLGGEIDKFIDRVCPDCGEVRQLALGTA